MNSSDSNEFPLFLVFEMCYSEDDLAGVFLEEAEAKSFVMAFPQIRYHVRVNGLSLLWTLFENAGKFVVEDTSKPMVKTKAKG